MNLVVNGILTNYQLINPHAKKDCLVLHGWGHHSGLWLNLCSQLNKNYRFILLDLPGSGATHFLPSDHNNVPDYSQFIVNFLSKLKITKTVIIGHSFGGQIAAYLGLKHPDLISQLILVSPAVIRRQTPKQKIKIFLFSRFNFLKTIIPKSIFQLLLKQFSSTDYYHASSHHKNILKKIVNFELYWDLPKISLPVILIWGDTDFDAPSVHAKTVANLLSDCRFYLIYDAGHNLYLTHPSEVTSIINRHLL